MLIESLVCPPCTAFKEDGEINYEIIDDYIDHLLKFNIKNVFLNGTTGEGNSLTMEERKATAECWLRKGRNRLLKIIIHIGTGNLKESQELARHAESIHADAIACVSPTYYKPQTIEDYVNYMSSVAFAAPSTPFYLYDIDFITGLNFSMNDFFTLAKNRIPTLKGLKHTSPSLPSMHQLLVDHPSMQVLMGTDDFYLSGLSIGLDVTICNSYLGNVLARLRSAFMAGDFVMARKEQERAVKVCSIRRKLGFSIPGFSKAVLGLIGLKMGQPRLPLSPTPTNLVQTLKEELDAIGFFHWIN